MYNNKTYINIIPYLSAETMYGWRRSRRFRNYSNSSTMAYFYHHTPSPSYNVLDYYGQRNHHNQSYRNETFKFADTVSTNHTTDKVVTFYWWTYVLMVLGMFLICLLLNYIVKKINEARSEERLSRRFGKSPKEQTSRYQMPAQPQNNPPDKKTRDPDLAISMIFTKEENLLHLKPNGNGEQVKNVPKKADSQHTPSNKNMQRPTSTKKSIQRPTSSKNSIQRPSSTKNSAQRPTSTKNSIQRPTSTKKNTKKNFQYPAFTNVIDHPAMYTKNSIELPASTKNSIEHRASTKNNLEHPVYTKNSIEHPAFTKNLANQFNPAIELDPSENKPIITHSEDTTQSVDSKPIHSICSLIKINNNMNARPTLPNNDEAFVIVEEGKSEALKNNSSTEKSVINSFKAKLLLLTSDDAKSTSERSTKSQISDPSIKSEKLFSKFLGTIYNINKYIMSADPSTEVVKNYYSEATLVGALAVSSDTASAEVNNKNSSQITLVGGPAVSNDTLHPLHSSGEKKSIIADDQRLTQVETKDSVDFKGNEPKADVLKFNDISEIEQSNSMESEGTIVFVEDLNFCEDRGLAKLVTKHSVEENVPKTEVFKVNDVSDIVKSNSEEINGKIVYIEDLNSYIAAESIEIDKGESNATANEEITLTVEESNFDEIANVTILRKPSKAMFDLSTTMTKFVESVTNVFGKIISSNNSNSLVNAPSMDENVTTKEMILENKTLLDSLILSKDAINNETQKMSYNFEEGTKSEIFSQVGISKKIDESRPFIEIHEDISNDNALRKPREPSRVASDTIFNRSPTDSVRRIVSDKILNYSDIEKLNAAKVLNRSVNSTPNDSFNAIEVQDVVRLMKKTSGEHDILDD